MSFQEVEGVLGFELPASARQYPAWWSNNVGTHVGARAWREAGWKTSRVDVGGERVTFVREETPMVSVREEAQPFARDAELKAAAGQEEAIQVPIANLSLSAARMIDDYAEATGLDRAAAVAVILEASAAARRRQLLDSLSVAAMPPGHDSTPMIRQDRDER
jgi:hypothetical protein